MSTFTFLFVLMLALATTVQLALGRRHIRHVRRHRSHIPQAFAGHIPLDAHQKAARYTIAKTHFGAVDTLIGAVLTIAWTLGGGLQLLDAAWRASPLAGLGPLAIGTAFVVSFFLINGLLEVPLSAYRTFVLEQRFGFNRTSFRVFVGDHIKQSVLLTLLGIPLIGIILWLMRNAGDLWWLFVWLTWLGFSLLMIWAYPAFIAPLFNRFSPLRDETLEQRIRSLLERAGFSVEGLYVMDGSRRSAHGNAYFTGLGENRRIVFFDTLLEELDADEIEAVLAHELGHFRLRHVRERIASAALLMLAGLGLLGWLIQQQWFFTGLGVHEPSLHAALALFVLVGPPFAFLLQPLLNFASRRHEFEADDFAAKLGTAQALVSALIKLYRENASTLTPDPLYSAFHDSHPPAAVRVAHLLSRIPA